MAKSKSSPKYDDVHQFTQLISDAISKDLNESHSIPDRIRIMGRDILINVVSKVDEQNSNGEMCEETLIIKVKAGQTEAEEVDTVLHETLHAVSYLLDLKMSERQVRLTATALIAILQDNPSFAWYVTKPIIRPNIQAST